MTEMAVRSKLQQALQLQNDINFSLVNTQNTVNTLMVIFGGNLQIFVRFLL
jgi:hypothetical protein